MQSKNIRLLIEFFHILLTHISFLTTAFLKVSKLFAVTISNLTFIVGFNKSLFVHVVQRLLCVSFIYKGNGPF